MSKAFAVAKFPLKRSVAYGPNSSSWTLYNPKKLADDLNLDVDVVDSALEQNGFYKAVRIREELIKWKERLRAEQATITHEIQDLNKERKILVDRQTAIRDQLENVRNLLRIPREKS